MNHRADERRTYFRPRLRVEPFSTPAIRMATAPSPVVEAPPEPAIEPELVEDEQQGVLDELWHRRQRVQSLRLRGFSQRQIAEALNVSQGTISNDLKWVREHRREQFGVPARFDPEQEIGEAVALFAEVEASALRDYSRLPQNNVKDRNVCLRTAMSARLSRVHTLQDQGILERQVGTVGIAIRADAVRATLVREGLLLGSGEATVIPDDDPIEQWLRRTG